MNDEKIRIDKWLWAARFFKTRQLAHDALELGRVKINGVRAKASRAVQLNDVLDLHIQQLDYRVTVCVLANQRRSAKEASLLYSEDAKVLAERKQKILLQQAEKSSFPHGKGRPDKKGRRQINQLKRHGDT